MALLGAQAPATPAGSIWRSSALIVALLAWSSLFERIGFLVTSVIAYAAILVIANYDRWTPRIAVAYSAVGALVLGGLYAIFHFLLAGTDAPGPVAPGSAGVQGPNLKRAAIPPLPPA